MALFEEARDVLAAFDDSGIRAVALKGLSVHARGLYPNLSDRPMNDVDLLVRPDRARAATELLLDLGYLPHHPVLAGEALESSCFHPRRLLAYLAAAGDLNFIHRDRPWAWIDLHWNLARCDRFKGSVRMSAAEVVEAAERLPDAAPPFPNGSMGRYEASWMEERKNGRMGSQAKSQNESDRTEAQPSSLPAFHSSRSTGLGFPVCLPHPAHELLYLSAHHAIFNHAIPSHTLEDVRRLIEHCELRIADCGLVRGDQAPSNPQAPIPDPQSLSALARTWGVERALRRTLAELGNGDNGISPRRHEDTKPPSRLWRYGEPPAFAFGSGVASADLSRRSPTGGGGSPPAAGVGRTHQDNLVPCRLRSFRASASLAVARSAKAGCLGVENPFFTPAVRELSALDGWADRARWLRRVIAPSREWLDFAYGPGRRPGAHWTALMVRYFSFCVLRHWGRNTQL